MTKVANSPRRAANLWDVLLRIVNRAFSTGYAVPMIFGLIFLGALWIISSRLESKDLKDLLELIVTTWWLAFGWLLFVVSSIVYIIATRWMQARYDAEIARQRQIIERFLPPDQTDKFRLETKP
jgi:hypothetical protein